MKLIDMIENQVQNNPDKIAVISQKENITYSKLKDRIDKLSYALAEFGLQPQDKIALILGNTQDWIVSFFAITKLGGIVVPVNPGYKEEMKYILQDSESSFIIVSSKTQNFINKIFPTINTIKKVIVIGKEVLHNFISYEDIMSQSNFKTVSSYPSDENDTAVIIYTNAYSGYYLGAELTHSNLIFDAEQSKKAVNANSNDRFLAALPFFHAFGLNVNIVLSFLIGASTVIIERFFPELVLEIIQKEKPTIFAGAPAMFAMLSSVPNDYDISSLRLCISGGAKLTQEIREKFEKKFNTELREGYGITECSPVCSLNNPFIKNKHGSIGKPYSDIEIKIFDENTKELQPYEIGELVVRGKNIMKGYYKKEQETKKFLKNNFFYTGDLGYIDDEGYIFLTGLKKKMLICGGFNIYIKELERIILSHPKIEEVKIGYIEDVVFGQFPKLEVKLKKGEIATEQEIIDFCKENLASYKVPKKVSFY